MGESQNPKALAFLGTMDSRVKQPFRTPVSLSAVTGRAHVTHPGIVRMDKSSIMRQFV